MNTIGSKFRLSARLDIASAAIGGLVPMLQNPEREGRQGDGLPKLGKSLRIALADPRNDIRLKRRAIWQNSHPHQVLRVRALDEGDHYK